MIRSRFLTPAAWFFLASALFLAVPVFAQCPPKTVLPVDSSSVNGRAPSVRYRSIHTVYLITSADMAAGYFPPGNTVTGIGWHYATAPGVAGSGTLTVYLQNTTDTTFSKSTSFTAALSGMTMVHSAGTALPNSTTPFDITFSGGSPFTYTGGGVYVAFDWSYPAGTLSTTATINTNVALVGGIESSQSTTATPASDTLTAASTRPETRFATSVANDGGVETVYTYGLLPNPVVGPQVVRASVVNRGTSSISNLPVTLNVTGANPFTDTVMVPFLASCTGQTTVSFAPFSPASLGTDSVTVSIPADSNPTNNAKTVAQIVTLNRYSYAYPGSSRESLSLGITNNTTGEITSKFTTLASTQIDSATVEFVGPAPSVTYQISIRADNGAGGPGAQLYVDPFNRTPTAAGVTTARLVSPVVVPAGNFYVGVFQSSTVPLNLAFNYEVPLGVGEFYLSTAAGGFTDMSAVGYTFRIPLGAVLGACVNQMTVDVTPNADFACVGNSLTFSAGAANATGSVTYQWLENGVEIPSATSSNLTVTKNAAGSFPYNCRVTDDAGCTNIVDPTNSSGTWGASPAEATGLVFAPDKQTLGWSPAFGATRYDLVRGEVAQLPVGPGGGDEQCFPDIAGTSTIDASVPLSGSGYWYVLRAENACGAGTYGSQSNGTPRITMTCP